RLAVEEIPQKLGEARALLHHLEIAARGEDRAFDLAAIAHDAGVLHQLLDALGRVARNLFRLETVERAAKVVTLAQNGDPGEPGLKAVENELLVKRAVVIFGDAPLLVVISDVERVLLRPRAALEAVDMDDGSFHSAAFGPPGNAKRAHAGLTSCMATPPAAS